MAWSSGRAQDTVADHFAVVRYIGTGGDEHYVGLAEAALVPFEKGRMARDIPAYHDIAHTPGRYWAAATGELVEFESHRGTARLVLEPL